MREVGEFGSGNEGFTCADSIVDVLGLQPLLKLAAALVIPPIVAAWMMRPWASFTAVTALIAVSAFGVAQWSGFWILALTGALPMVAVGLGISVIDVVLTRRKPDTPPSGVAVAE